MRPIPARKHHWAVAVLLAIVAGNTCLTFHQTNVTGDQANMLTEVLKAQDPLLYPNDGVFADHRPGAPWQLRTPAWRGLLALSTRLAGEDDPLNGLRLIGAASLLVYLVLMYMLLYRQTHSTSAATVVAAMSLAIFSVKRPYWGMGPLFAVTPATVYLAGVPLVALLFVSSHKRWTGAGVFFLAGLGANLHASSAAILVTVLLLSLLLAGQARPRAWARAALGAFAAVVAAAPALYYYFVTFRASAFALPKMSIPTLRAILQLAGINVLYPGVLVQAVRWLPVAAALAMPATIILSRAGKYRLRELPCWLAMLAAALVVAFGLHGLVQLAARMTGTMPVALELFDALRLAMLPLYVLFAQAMVHLVRLSHTHRGWVRAALTVVAVAYLGSSYNTLPIRHKVADTIMAVAQRPRPYEGEGKAAACKELRALARHVKGLPHSDALFVTDEAEVRLYGQRSVTCCGADVRYLYHLAPKRLGEWAGRLEAQRKLLNPPEGTRADAAQIVAFIDAYWRIRRETAATTYVVVSTHAAPAETEKLKDVTPTEETWGKHWRLFKADTPETDVPLETQPADVEPPLSPRPAAEPGPLR